jgi:antitoxin PrlF
MEPTMRAATGASTVTGKGQITVPRPVRDELDLQAGDRLIWSLHEDGRVEIRKENLRPLREIVGLLGRPARGATVEEMDEALRARFRDEHRAPRR